MTLDDLYRDVNARLSVYNEYREQFYSQDVIKALNDAIAEVRVKATQSRNAREIAVTQVLDTFTVSTTHPYLVESTLTLPLINTVDPSLSILQADFWVSGTALTNGFTTAVSGDQRYIGGTLYSCVANHTAENNFTKTFDPKDIRTFYPNNGAKFFVGEIIFKDGVYWKVIEDFVNNEDQTFAETSRFSKMYWAKLSSAFGVVSIYPFERLGELKLLNESHCTGTRGIAVKDTKVYASPNVPKMTITYVPEWATVTNLDSTIELPTEWVSEVKTMAIDKLQQRLKLTPQ
jgi:hypothetical protein